MLLEDPKLYPCILFLSAVRERGAAKEIVGKVERETTEFSDFLYWIGTREVHEPCTYRGKRKIYTCIGHEPCTHRANVSLYCAILTRYVHGLCTYGSLTCFWYTPLHTIPKARRYCSSLLRLCIPLGTLVFLYTILKTSPTYNSMGNHKHWSEFSCIKKERLSKRPHNACFSQNQGFPK